jgi:hypothetical protein
LPALGFRYTSLLNQSSREVIDTIEIEIANQDFTDKALR